MECKEYKILIKNYSKLCSVLVDINNLVPELVSCKVIGYRAKEEMRSANDYEKSSNSDDEHNGAYKNWTSSGILRSPEYHGTTWPPSYQTTSCGDQKPIKSKG